MEKLSKVYVLQKEWVSPFFAFPVGTEFSDPNESGYFSTDGELGSIPESKILLKGDWFKLKDEKIEVLNFTEIKMLGNGNDEYHYYTAVVKTPIPKEKYDAVKKAIEFVLNNDQYYIKSYPGEKMYSEKELLDAEEKAFEASYELNGFKYKYTSFKDYKNKK